MQKAKENNQCTWGEKKNQSTTVDQGKATKQRPQKVITPI